MRTWTVPGSILLAGEYRITESGGRGLAIGAGGRARLDQHSSGTPFSLQGKMGEAIIHWSPQIQEQVIEQRKLLAAEVYAVSGCPLSGQALVDTSIFSNSSGRKWGLGSSAAAAVLISQAMNPGIDNRQTLAHIALRAHRAFQGGLGSGYDVFCSAFGAAGLFKGGEAPEWTAISWPKIISGYLICGNATVSSAHAVSHFKQWKNKERTTWTSIQNQIDREIMSISQTLLQNPAGTASITAFFKHLKTLTQTGLLIGRHIGIPAELPIPAGLGQDIAQGKREGAVLKSVGAGNELGLLLYHPDALLDGEKVILKQLEKNNYARRLKIEYEGLREESMG